MSPLVPPPSSETKEHRDARMKWWHDAHFGMFIHYGLYAGLAGEYEGKPLKQDCVEWYQAWVGLDDETYDSMAKKLWKPSPNCTEQWAKLAKRAGCEYSVLTTKHHEGFCLFDSKHSDHTSPKLVGRDIVKEYMDSFRGEGLKPGLYHSLLDWHHPDYDNERAIGLAYPKDESEKRKGKTLDHQKYIEYLHKQTNEILSNYGEVSELWFDFSSPEFDGEEAWGGVTLLEQIRKDHPNIIVNNRLFKRDGSGNGDADNGTKFDYRYGDIITPEQFVPPTGIPGVNWESCMTLNDTWGYSKYDKNWKSNKKLIQTLATIVSRGGNFLLNVGPKADGSLTQETLDAFEAIGAWMDVNSESIKRTRASPFKDAFEWGVVTTGAEEGVLYAHVFDSAEKGPISLPVKDVKKAEILGSSAAVEIVKGESSVELKPGAFPHPDVTVVKIST